MFLILIGVILFAALSFTVSQMIRGGDSAEVITDQKGRLYASEILDYAQEIRRVVQNLKISHECDETEISFENNVISGYAHTPATRDACKIFHPDGGGLSYLAPDARWLDSNYAAQAHYGEWYMPSDIAHLDIPSGSGSSGFELSLFLPYIRKAVCDQINERLGVTSTGASTPSDSADSYRENTKYTGTLDTAAPDGVIDLSGVYVGCYQANAAASTDTAEANSYVFFQVLIQQ